jgi:acyl dehydratase
MIVIDAVLTLNSPRPPGAVHGGQTFDLERMPRVGETLRTDVWCLDKEIRKHRKWVRMRTETRALASSELLFTGMLTILVPQ